METLATLHRRPRLHLSARARPTRQYPLYQEELLSLHRSFPEIESIGDLHRRLRGGAGQGAASSSTCSPSAPCRDQPGLTVEAVVRAVLPGMKKPRRIEEYLRSGRSAAPISAPPPRSASARSVRNERQTADRDRRPELPALPRPARYTLCRGDLYLLSDRGRRRHPRLAYPGARARAHRAPSGRRDGRGSGRDCCRARASMRCAATWSPGISTCSRACATPRSPDFSAQHPQSSLFRSFLMLARTARILKLVAQLVAVSALTFLAVRAFDAHQSAPLALWHTFVPSEMEAEELDQADWAAYLAREQTLFDEVRSRGHRQARAGGAHPLQPLLRGQSALSGALRPGLEPLLHPRARRRAAGVRSSCCTA